MKNQKKILVTIVIIIWYNCSSKLSVHNFAIEIIYIYMDYKNAH